MTIVVFDIDGVLADTTHRERLVQQRPKDWDAFFAAVGADPVIEAGRARFLAEAEHAEVVLVSGRPERTRADTLRWLADNGMGEPRLLLRPDVDFRKAADLKEQLVSGLGSASEISLVIDDDASVIDRLAGLGYRAELFR